MACSLLHVSTPGMHQHEQLTPHTHPLLADRGSWPVTWHAAGSSTHREKRQGGFAPPGAPQPAAAGIALPLPAVGVSVKGGDFFSILKGSVMPTVFDFRVWAWFVL